MKMKMFSILLTLVCIGFVLMLAGDSVAQTKVTFEAEVESIIEERTYKVGDTTPLTITVKRGNAVQANQPITFRVSRFCGQQQSHPKAGSYGCISQSS